MKLRSGDPVVDFISGIPGLTYTKEQIERASASTTGADLEERVAKALEWLSTGKDKEPGKAVLTEYQNPQGAGYQIAPSPQKVEDGGPLEWVIERLSWTWHTWRDPIIKAQREEAERLLAPRRPLVGTVERWLSLVKQADRERNPAEAVRLLKEAETLEAKWSWGARSRRKST